MLTGRAMKQQQQNQFIRKTSYILHLSKILQFINLNFSFMLCNSNCDQLSSLIWKQMINDGLWPLCTTDQAFHDMKQKADDQWPVAIRLLSLFCKWIRLSPFIWKRVSNNERRAYYHYDLKMSDWWTAIACEPPS